MDIVHLRSPLHLEVEGGSAVTTRVLRGTNLHPQSTGYEGVFQYHMTVRGCKERTKNADGMPELQDHALRNDMSMVIPAHNVAAIV